MSKVFESQSLTDEADKRKKQYEALEEQLRALKQAFQGVADLGDALKGKGADNIKDFFQGQAEIADSWLTLVSAQIAFLNGISGDIKDQELSDTYVETSFLEHELPNADLKASEIVSAHKAEIDSILSGISDIIHLDTYTLDDYADKMGDAQKTRRDTITAVDTLDESLTAEYQNLESLDNAVLSKYSVLMQATSNGKSASPMYYDKKAFHSNEIYKSVTATEKQGTDYIDAKAQQAEARRLQEKAEEEANKPWYEKTWDGICNFTGEVTGYYDYKRAAEGVDPVTGEKLSTAERVTAGAMAAAGFIPVVGWAGRAFKGGKAIYKTGKTVIAAEHALDAYKTGKSLDILKMTEMGAYGLVASNGFTEAVTGRDMFGNKVSEEKRKQGALEAITMIGGAGLAHYFDRLYQKNAPYVNKVANESLSSNIAKTSEEKQTRLQYLRNKHGVLSKEDLHHRINLRAEVLNELNKIKSSGLTKKQRGPAVAGVLDKKTGKYYFGINNIDGEPPKVLHPLIHDRIVNMPVELKEGYIKTSGAGSHAEVNALNEALLQRPDAELKELMVYVVSARKINKKMPEGVPMPRCPHCEYITQNTNYIPEALKYGK
ncbi:putative transposase [Bacillus amyloliquefaciens KHG19]|uniref:LXG family T7SS effector putative deaminase YwqJ n=1 Tax=Bacillus amyloliquefaciens group TaxID=1938374 RepID=UPI0005AD203B|nr:MULTISPECIES: LXG family T7SS effector putative deaminase YwqJ [Bacillus amyloliquefaciens group]AJK67023.1 putative transposase [Bacillus amyloliquefaciens KHG19]MEC1827498.1 LXG family T7SS effector putative deaminase YwqJ [Bacillus velezensis]MEC2277244.1 LXG family T7SS effector putative deaminase YwqJ [Bacillus velezensis]MEC2312073.1 LXG family T7SS effector putative deaminase YwqJ [Bacillus velezensis]MED3700885.1 LXG family T7SS effector putative deaminase YwqJ [Bacillus velezensis]